MLVLSRKPGQRIQIGADVCITVLEVRGRAVRLGFEAPSHVPIHRTELIEQRGNGDDLSEGKLFVAACD